MFQKGAAYTLRHDDPPGCAVVHPTPNPALPDQSRQHRESSPTLLIGSSL